ncbi:hypothetical protein L2E82_26805 [Cichorium intybus]|uniref:Uncharacterized protein n=1 Tax=Cichorium intybus TaxID=13427 RepID=A0ACB9CRL1_CICIN|nr:hypothetical protein L2E82_26805 [Cichorium intybus]
MVQGFGRIGCMVLSIPTFRGDIDDPDGLPDIDIATVTSTPPLSDRLGTLADFSLSFSFSVSPPSTAADFRFKV